MRKSLGDTYGFQLNYPLRCARMNAFLENLVEHDAEINRLTAKGDQNELNELLNSLDNFDRFHPWTYYRYRELYGMDKGEVDTAADDAARFQLIEISDLWTIKLTDLGRAHFEKFRTKKGSA